MASAAEIRKRLRQEQRTEQRAREQLIIAAAAALERVEAAEHELTAAREHARVAVAAAIRKAGGPVMVARALQVEGRRLAVLARGVSAGEADRHAHALTAREPRRGGSRTGGLTVADRRVDRSGDE